MQVAEHIAAIKREGELLAHAAQRADLDADIPTCPGWRMRDLVQHIGGIHRWAAAHVAQRSLKPLGGFENVVEAWPPDAELVEWFRQGHANLVDTLERAEPELQCWSFLPAPSPLAFWARRQAHETGIHRADAESAGGAITEFEAAVAVDGIDELLLGFLPRPRTKLRADPVRSLHVHATDLPGEWLIRVKPDAVDVSQQHAPADCTLRGRASDLFLLLWNRLSANGVEVEGDRDLLETWRAQVQIRWS